MNDLWNNFRRTPHDASASMFYIAIDYKITIIIIIIINIINNFFFVGIIVFRPKKLIKASYKPNEMKFL